MRPGSGASSPGYRPPRSARFAPPYKLAPPPAQPPTAPAPPTPPPAALHLPLARPSRPPPSRSGPRPAGCALSRGHPLVAARNPRRPQVRGRRPTLRL